MPPTLQIGDHLRQQVSYGIRIPIVGKRILPLRHRTATT
jgi:hypothetical protein